MFQSFGWAAVAALLAASTAHAGCKLRVYGDLSLQPSPSRALIKGAVDGHPVVFIVDTGAWTSSMPIPDARRLGVKIDDSNIFVSTGIGGGVSSGEAHFSMKLGQLDLPRESMAVLAMGSLDHDAVCFGSDLTFWRRTILRSTCPTTKLKLLKLGRFASLDELVNFYWGKPAAEVALQTGRFGAAAHPLQGQAERP